MRRRRSDAAEEDGEAIAGDVPRRRPDGDEAGEEEAEEDEQALEARRAAVRERCALLGPEKSAAHHSTCDSLA